jgi:hypothetical protein
VEPYDRVGYLECLCRRSRLELPRLPEQLFSRVLKSSTRILPQCSRRTVWNRGGGARERSLIKSAWRFKWPRRNNVPRNGRYLKPIAGSGGTRPPGREIVRDSTRRKKEAKESSLPTRPVGVYKREGLQSRFEVAEVDRKLIED